MCAFWVEKAITTFAPAYRSSGTFAIGASLISPVSTGSGADRYRAMRDVKRGDIVLHFINNESIAAMSAASGSFRVVRPGSTEMLAVPLECYTDIRPPLTREEIFAPPYGDELLRLLERGLKNTFFTKRLQLAQGAYLTPVPAELFAVLDEAYGAKCAGGLSAIVERVRQAALIGKG